MYEAWGFQCRILMKNIVWSAPEGVRNLLTNVFLTCTWRSINIHDTTEPILTFECEGLKSENDTRTSQIQMIEMWQQSTSHPAFVPPPPFSLPSFQILMSAPKGSTTAGRTPCALTPRAPSCASAIRATSGSMTIPAQVSCSAGPFFFLQAGIKWSGRCRYSIFESFSFQSNLFVWRFC